MIAKYHIHLATEGKHNGRMDDLTQLPGLRRNLSPTARNATMDTNATPKRPPGRPRKSPPKVRAFTRPKVLEKTVKREMKWSEELDLRIRKFLADKKKTLSAETRRLWEKELEGNGY